MRAKAGGYYHGKHRTKTDGCARARVPLVVCASAEETCEQNTAWEEEKNHVAWQQSTHYTVIRHTCHAARWSKVSPYFIAVINVLPERGLNMRARGGGVRKRWSLSDP